VVLPVKNNTNPEKREVKEILEVVMVVTMKITVFMESTGLQDTASQKKVIFKINFIHIKRINK
jgi:hypothetical protein